MILYPNAKINLGLNVVRKRRDGYHDLETVFYPIPLTDTLSLSPAGEGDLPYTLTLDGHRLEGSQDDNLVIRAYRLLQEKGYALKLVSIHLTKKIPSGAGLGGGSADAAFMLKALNEMNGLQLSRETLEEYAAELGADCAVFIQNQPVYAEGIGNVFTPIELNLSGYWLVVIKPDVFISTKAAFSQIKPMESFVSLQKIIAYPVEKWKDWMRNDFEDSVFPQFPQLARLKEQLYAQGAIYASMSGSGSSLYGIFRDNVDLASVFPGCFYTCLPL